MRNRSHECSNASLFFAAGAGFVSGIIASAAAAVAGLAYIVDDLFNTKGGRKV